MKKTLILAAVFVTGAATVGIAQHANESKGSVVTNGSVVATYQDTTKPVTDSIPEKKDSATVNF